MNKTRQAALMLSSLSIFRGILDHDVPGAFYKLLCASESTADEFSRAWGRFFSLLCDHGYSESLMRCMTNAALYDENSFSRAAASAAHEELPQQVKAAAVRDISAILNAASLTPEQIIEDCACRSELGETADMLPKWKTGTPVWEFESAESAFDRLSGFYRANGCGIYARYRAFIWRNKDIEPVVYPDSIKLEEMIGYQRQRQIVIDNTTAFLNGAECNNCLLYGDMGTGKSSTVKAILNEYYIKGLRMVELPKDRLADFPLLSEKLAPLPMHFIIFIDDLSFSGEDKSFAQLKAVLEGGLAVRPTNTLIYATSNRRHLIRENFSDREGDEIHRNDSIQESLSLSDRFGLNVNFSKPGKDEYIAIVLGLAAHSGLDLSEEELIAGAERWAITKGGRSPRSAKQYVSYVQAELINKKG